MGIARHAGADAIDDGIGADRERREQGEADGAAVELCEIPAPARRKEKHAAHEADQTDPADEAQPLAEPCRADRRGEERRRATRDRIDLAHVAGAIGFDQTGEITEMNEHRGDHPRPRLRGRQPDQRDERDCHEPGADRDQDRDDERIEPALDRRVPAGMGGGGEQDGGKDEGIHGRAFDREP